MDGVQFAVYGEILTLFRRNVLSHINNNSLGLKILISLLCFGATFYQGFVLFDNFKSKDTLRKNTEVTYPNNYTTPMIIVCSDPGNTEPENPLIALNTDGDIYGLIPPVKTFTTMWKVDKIQKVK